MVSLAKEDIQFIDTYLENSDVVFADIRMEMVDHVASDIEDRIEAGDNRGFYDVFKDYMVKNKAQLLKDNRQFLKSADRKIWKTLIKEFFSPMTLILFLVCCIGFYFLHQSFNLESFKLYVSLVPLLALMGFLLTYVVYHNFKKLKRFSAVERLALPYFCLYEITNIVFNFSNSYEDKTDILWLIVGVSFALTLMFILFKVSLKLFKSYNSQYKTLA